MNIIPKWIRRAGRNTVRLFKLWDALRFLDRQCLSIRLGNESRQFIGHWNCDGDFLQTVEEARKRIGYQTTRVKHHGHDNNSR